MKGVFPMALRDLTSEGQTIYFLHSKSYPEICGRVTDCIYRGVPMPQDFSSLLYYNEADRAGIVTSTNKGDLKKLLAEFPSLNEHFVISKCTFTHYLTCSNFEKFARKHKETFNAPRGRGEIYRSVFCSYVFVQEDKKQVIVQGRPIIRGTDFDYDSLRMAEISQFGEPYAVRLSANSSLTEADKVYKQELLVKAPASVKDTLYFCTPYLRVTLFKMLFCDGFTWPK